MSHYRNENSDSIEYDEWISTFSASEATTETVDYKSQDVDVFIKFIGLPHCLYKVLVNCDPSILKYHNYSKNHTSLISAQADYDRVKLAISNDEQIVGVE